jgi:hypothetical protein
MKIVEAILATSHVDLHNERLTPSALEGMVRQINLQCIPMGLEHDPRIPPQGRVLSAGIQQLEDGEYAVRGVIQQFEPGDEIELVEDGREIPLHEHSDGSIHLTYDRSYKTLQDQELLKQLAKISGAQLHEEAKKSLDPLSTLAVAGKFVLGEIASGLLKRIGSDGWDAFKGKLGDLLARRKEAGQENLLTFECIVPVDDHRVSVEVHLSNPSREDVHAFFEEGLKLLDVGLAPFLNSSPHLRRLVIQYEQDKMLVKFGVRKDAVPMAFHEEGKSSIADLILKK